jgi:hypothetical protein
MGSPAESSPTNDEAGNGISGSWNVSKPSQE